MAADASTKAVPAKPNPRNEGQGIAVAGFLKIGVFDTLFLHNLPPSKYLIEILVLDDCFDFNTI